MDLQAEFFKVLLKVELQEFKVKKGGAEYFKGKGIFIRMRRGYDMGEVS